MVARARRQAMEPRIGLAVALLLLVGGAAQAHAAKVMAIDIGGDTSKMVVVKPGSTPFAIVTNEFSKRKTPTKISFTDGVRRFGEEAKGLEVRYPGKVFTRLRDALGQPFSLEGREQSRIGKIYKTLHRPYDLNVTAKGHSIAFRTDEGEEFTSEELMAMVLQYFAQLGATFSGSHRFIKEAAFVVPTYFGAKERAALSQAIDIAGLSSLGFISSASAGALHYAKDRRFHPEGELVLFFNMGATYSEAALVRFSSHKDLKRGKRTKKDKKPQAGKGGGNRVELVDVAWQAEVGGDNLDAALATWFATEYDASLLSSPKSMAKLLAQARKTKEVLSANTECPVSVEGVDGDRDMQMHITREQFEQVVKGEVDKAVSPLAKLLSRHPEVAGQVREQAEKASSGDEEDDKEEQDVSVEKMKNRGLLGVELLGGSSRVPVVQRALVDVLGGRPLDRHLDGDESAVMGAALFAANNSAYFAIRPTELIDRVPYGFELDVHVIDTNSPLLERSNETKAIHVDAVDASIADAKVETVQALPPMAAASVEEEYTFELHNVTNALQLRVRYASDGEVPPGFEKVREEVLAKLVCMGSERAHGNGEGEGAEIFTPNEVEEFKVDPTAKLVAVYDSQHTGVGIQIQSASQGSQYYEYVTREKRLKNPDYVQKKDKAEGEGEAVDLGSAEDGGANATANATDASVDEIDDNPEYIYKNVTTREFRRKNVPLNVGTLFGSWNTRLNYRQEDGFVNSIHNATERLIGLNLRDKDRKALEEVRNRLESRILEWMSKVSEAESDEEMPLARVSTAEQLAGIQAALGEAEDWLYTDEADTATLEVVEGKLSEMDALVTAVQRRAEALESRPELVESTRGKLAGLKQRAARMAVERPWAAAHVANASLAVDEMEVWFNETVIAQSELPDTEDPVLLEEDVSGKIRKVNLLFKKAKRVPAPPTPPPVEEKGKKEEGGSEGGESKKDELKR